MSCPRPGLSHNTKEKEGRQARRSCAEPERKSQFPKTLAFCSRERLKSAYSSHWLGVRGCRALGHVGLGIDTVFRILATSKSQYRSNNYKCLNCTYGRATSNLFSISFSTAWSASLLTKEMERPFVPNRPARPTRWRYESASAGRS